MIAWIFVVVIVPTFYIWFFVDPLNYPIAAWGAFWYVVFIHFAWFCHKE